MSIKKIKEDIKKWDLKLYNECYIRMYDLDDEEIKEMAKEACSNVTERELDITVKQGCVSIYIDGVLFGLVDLWCPAYRTLSVGMGYNRIRKYIRENID